MTMYDNLLLNYSEQQINVCARWFILQYISRELNISNNNLLVHTNLIIAKVFFYRANSVNMKPFFFYQANSVKMK